MRKLFLKHCYTWLLIALVFSIGIATLAISISEFIHSAATDHLLAGDSENIVYPGFDYQHLKSHEFQNYSEKLVSKKLRLRNYFVRINNQIYYSLFKKSFAENSGVIVGKNNQLFQKQYINAYCRPQTLSSEELIHWADQLKRMNDYFAARKITFIYLITPSKAEYLPEAIPDRFHCQRRGLHPQLLQLEKLLTARGIPYVNGPALLEKAKQEYPTTLFPQGGTHWNWLGATIGLKALLEKIDHDSNSPIRPLSFRYAVENLNLNDADADLLHLTNLLRPDLSYRVPQVYFLNPLPSPLVATIIGGSFNDNLVKLMLKYRMFSKINFYFYFRAERSFVDGKKDPVDRKLDPKSPAILKSLLASQILVLEENSSLIARSEQGKKLWETLKF